MKDFVILIKQIECYTKIINRYIETEFASSGNYKVKPYLWVALRFIQVQFLLKICGLPGICVKTNDIHILSGNMYNHKFNLF